MSGIAKGTESIVDTPEKTLISMLLKIILKYSPVPSFRQYF